MNFSAGRLLSLLLFSTSSLALDCTLPPEKAQMECVGTKRVKSLDALNTYLTDYAVNDEGQAKHLLIDFDMELGANDLAVATPCRVRLKKNRKVQTTGSLCLNGYDGIRIHPQSYIRAKDINLFSDKRIAIQNNADIKADNILLDSYGDSLEARVHIRHHSKVEANSLTLNGHARATLGHTSTYNVTGAISLTSKEVFSAIWKESIINAGSVVINSENRTRISKGVNITAETIDVSGPECTAKKAIINSNNQPGDCFVAGRPIARYSVSKKSASTGEEITFNASKTSDDKGIVKYVWTFSEGDTFETTNPILKKSFAEEGIYRVSVVAHDADGFRSTKTKKITITGAPLVQKDPEVFFSFRTTDNSITLIYHAPNLDNVASADYVLKDGTVIPVEDLTHLSLMTFDDFEHGDYEVTLVVKTQDNKEYKYTHDQIKVATTEELAKTQAYVDITPVQVGPKKVLVDIRKVFDLTDNMHEFEIDWGDGQIEEIDNFFASGIFHTYSKAGNFEINFKVRKESENGPAVYTEVTKSINVTTDDVVAMNPVADFKVIKEDFAPHVTFDINNSFSPTSDIVSSVWDHGDGTFYTAGEQVHTHFYNPGVYKVKLTVTDSLGLQSSQIQNVVVVEAGPPVITTALCGDVENKSVECDFIAVDAQNQISKLQINWGDGNVENIDVNGVEFVWESLAHEYNDFGEYKVVVNLETIRGENATKEVTVNVEDIVPLPPVANLNCTANELSVNCDASGSIDSDGQIVEYEFDFKDGNVVTGSNPLVSYTYSNGGHFQISVKVTDNSGMSSYDSYDVDVVDNSGPGDTNENPNAFFTCQSNSELTLTCDASSSSDSDGIIVDYEFTIDDQVLSGPGPIQNFSFENAGFKMVTLKVTDNEGASSSFTDLFEVLEANHAPVAAFECTSTEINKMRCIGTNSSDVDGDLLTYEWTIDGKQFNNESIDYSFASGGLKSVKLKVKDPKGLSDELVKDVNVISNVNPIAKFSCTSTEDKNIKCSSESSDVDGSIQTYKWIIDGELISTINYLDHNFLVGGTKNVELVISDNLGAEDKSIQVINVLDVDLPIAVIDLVSDKFSSTEEININGSLSSSSLGEIVSYRWYLDNTLVSNEVESTLNNLDIGNHTLKLEVFDTKGQSASDSIDFLIFHDLEPNIVKTVIKEGAPKEVRFSIMNIEEFGDIKSIIWSYPHENKESKEVESVFTFNYVGEYEILLKIRNSEDVLFEKVIPVNISNNSNIYIEGPNEIELIDIVDKQVAYNVIGEGSSALDNVSIFLNEEVDSIKIENNIFSFSSENNSIIPDIVTLSVEIDGVIYSREIKIKLNTSIKVTTVLAGDLITKIENTGTDLDGTVIDFSNGEFESGSSVDVFYFNGSGNSLNIFLKAASGEQVSPARLIAPDGFTFEISEGVAHSSLDEKYGSLSHYFNAPYVCASNKGAERIFRLTRIVDHLIKSYKKDSMHPNILYATKGEEVFNKASFEKIKKAIISIPNFEALTFKVFSSSLKKAEVYKNELGVVYIHSGIATSSINLIRLLLLHEIRHVQQFNIMKCQVWSLDTGTNGKHAFILESEAEHYAFSQVAKVDQYWKSTMKEYLDGRPKDSFGNTATAFKNFFTLLEGGLKYGPSLAKAYKPVILWDFINGNILFSKIAEKKLNVNGDLIDLLRSYDASNGGDDFIHRIALASLFPFNMTANSVTKYLAEALKVDEAKMNYDGIAKNSHSDDIELNDHNAALYMFSREDLGIQNGDIDSIYIKFKLAEEDKEFLNYTLVGLEENVEGEKLWKEISFNLSSYDKNHSEAIGIAHIVNYEKFMILVSKDLKDSEGLKKVPITIGKIKKPVFTFNSPLKFPSTGSYTLSVSPPELFFKEDGVINEDYTVYFNNKLSSVSSISTEVTGHHCYGEANVTAKVVDKFGYSTTIEKKIDANNNYVAPSITLDSSYSDDIQEDGVSRINTHYNPVGGRYTSFSLQICTSDYTTSQEDVCQGADNDYTYTNWKQISVNALIQDCNGIIHTINLR